MTASTSASENLQPTTPAASIPQIVNALIEEARDLHTATNMRLTKYSSDTRRFNPPVAAAIDRLVARLDSNHVGLTAPKAGEPMPDFLLPDDSGRLHSLSRLRGDGPVVISFNRGHWCPYCRLHFDALAKAHEDIARLGARLVAITPDTGQWSAEIKRFAEAPFPFLSDIDNGYALELNLLFWTGDEMSALLAASGMDAARSQGNDTWMLPIPATFVVDRDGIVRARHVDPDYRRRMEIDDLLAAVRAAQATE